jgi:putative ABC transport system substrate-binding protein
MFGIRRREFITLIGGAAAWPLAARAQQAERVRRIGVLSGTAEDDQDTKIYLAAFVKELQQQGWTDGRNVQIDYRFVAGNPENYPKYAAELVALAPDVILAPGRARQLDRASRCFEAADARIGSGIDITS